VAVEAIRHLLAEFVAVILHLSGSACELNPVVQKQKLSVGVALPASGWEMIAKVRRLATGSKRFTRASACL